MSPKSLLIFLLCLLAATLVAAEVPSASARKASDHARQNYSQAVEDTLAELVTFKTFKTPDQANTDNPEFHAMTEFLAARAKALGLEFQDLGAAVVIALGEGQGPADRIGIVTHGDIQPADPSKWAKSPFVLDRESEPGRLIARGAEDDKGPIATALYSLKTLKDLEIPLAKRVELVIAYTEESDWTPFQKLLETWQPPAINVVIDSAYPVVVAEKGWSSVHLTAAPPEVAVAVSGPRLLSIEGGAFLSQIPADARAVIADPAPALVGVLGDRARTRKEVEFQLKGSAGKLEIIARGKAAHSSTPENGVNAITHLAALLGGIPWPETQAARTVRLINDLVGLGNEAENFGDVAYGDEFMGPLTLSLTTLEQRDDQTTLGINIRRPVGRSNEEVDRSVRQAVAAWSEESSIPVAIETSIGEPYFPEGAPQVDTLLAIFESYTGQQDPKPLSIGGGTHARLLPNGVNFGPAMPGKAYTGHTEHEFITRDQLRLNLEMYTAMMVELAAKK
ncbi:MAG: dipeptidase [Acidobacteriota bacterium]